MSTSANVEVKIWTHRRHKAEEKERLAAEAAEQARLDAVKHGNDVCSLCRYRKDLIVDL